MNLKLFSKSVIPFLSFVSLLRLTSASVKAFVPAKIKVKSVVVLVAHHAGRVSWSRQNILAFSQYPDGSLYHGEIYTMNPDGKHKKCLTCRSNEIPHLNNDQPSWYPTGKYVLFQSVDPLLYKESPLPSRIKKYLTQGGAGIDNNLWLATSNGSKFYQLTHVKQGEASLLAQFSFHGKKLLWTARIVKRRVHAPWRRQGKWALKIADFSEGTHGPRLKNVKTYQPFGANYFYESGCFTPDGKSIFFAASPPGPYDMDIYKMNLKTGKVINLTHSPGVWDEHPSISPDGKKIAWISSKGYAFTPSYRWGRTLRTELWMMNPDGSKKKQLTFFNAPGAAQDKNRRVILSENSWSPDGKQIAVSMMVFKKGREKTTKIILLTLSKEE